jgi:hypothetical protein
MPDGSTRVEGRLLRARPFRARISTGMMATAVLVVVGLGPWGGGPFGPAVASGRSPATAQLAPSSGSPAQQALAFSECMRRHGLANFPDPNGSGNFPASAKQIAFSDPHQFQEARTACSHLLPNNGNGPTQAQWQQILSTMVQFAHCMRHHGRPNWPDPTYDTHGRPVFNIDVDPNSPQFTAEIHACQHLLHNYGSRPGWPDLSNYFE